MARTKKTKPGRHRGGGKQRGEVLSALKGMGWKNKKKSTKKKTLKGAGLKKKKKHVGIKIDQKQLAGVAPLNELSLFRSQLATKSR